MSDLFLSAATVDAYLKDLLERLYRSSNSPNPEVWCPIGTSGLEVCNRMLDLASQPLKASIGLLKSQLNRATGDVAFYTYETNSQISDDEVSSDLAGKCVLLIDGLVYSGGTIKRVYNAAKNHRPSTLVTYSTVIRNSSCMIPNYFSVLASQFERAWLPLVEPQTFPNKRLDSLGNIRIPDNNDSQLPLATSTDAQPQTWADISEKATKKKDICYIYEKDEAIQGYIAFRFSMENSTLIIRFLESYDDPATTCVPGDLFRWAETYANAQKLVWLQTWVPESSYDLFLEWGFQFVLENGHNIRHGTLMKREVQYLLPYGGHE